MVYTLLNTFVYEYFIRLAGNVGKVRFILHAETLQCLHTVCIFCHGDD